MAGDDINDEQAPAKGRSRGRVTLAEARPDLAAQWHPTRNGALSPAEVGPGSHKKVWWVCSLDPSHEWAATIKHRTDGTNCPFCVNKRVSQSNSLSAKFPNIANEWHPTKNGDLTPASVTGGSNRRVWWQCAREASHEWQTSVANRTGTGTGCPGCAGKVVTPATSVRSVAPNLVTQWHPTLNGELTPDNVAARGDRLIWWSCPVAPDHVWRAGVGSRVRVGAGCPCCSGQKVSVTNSLATTNPKIAQEWAVDLNNGLTSDQVVGGSSKRGWWRCTAAGHEWRAVIASRARNGHACPYCSNQKASKTNSLRARSPILAEQWHPTKNGATTPDTVVAGSAKKAWWVCPVDPQHEWKAAINSRLGGRGCPYCTNRLPSSANSLAARFPEVAAEWHPTKNDALTPDDVVAGSHQSAWWRCAKVGAHEWQGIVGERTGPRAAGCPLCAGQRWSLATIRIFVASLREHLAAFDAAELYTILAQNGLIAIQGQGRGFVDALRTGRFPAEEIEKFVAGEPSLVDEYIEAEGTKGSPEGGLAEIAAGSVALESGDVSDLPQVGATGILQAVDAAIGALSTADEEAVAFLVASARAKLWKRVFASAARGSGEDPAATAEHVVEEARAFVGTEYARQVSEAFLGEYQAALDLEIPAGFNPAFAGPGTSGSPNLMQRLGAVRVRDGRRVGNWSGTGAGKTLSAILSSRVIGAQLTVICCPNSVVGEPADVVTGSAGTGWVGAIRAAYPDSRVIAKTLSPQWGFGDSARYLVLNYEQFQRPESAQVLEALLAEEKVDLIVIDEIHQAKQRDPRTESRRRENVGRLVASASQGNPALAVVGMSATPVINNLQEGKSLVELITGMAHDDLDTEPTVENCLALHQKLVTLGIRWKPDYAAELREDFVAVDCTSSLDAIRALGKRDILGLEMILTEARLPTILARIIPGTVVYTHLVDGIVDRLVSAIREQGWRVGVFTGDEKSGLDRFKRQEIDVLVASSAIGTGVDGLQHVSNRLIVNVLPWTAAEYEQLIGRIYRQGQQAATVDVIVPVTSAPVSGVEWSWCRAKVDRIRFKKSIADAAVDGVVPEGRLRSKEQEYDALMGWLKRLEDGDLRQIVRLPILIPSAEIATAEPRSSRYGDFSAMNNRINAAHSGKTHDRFAASPEEWEQYHALYRAARAQWSVVPFEELISFYRTPGRVGLALGDFGAGEAKLHEALGTLHTIHSFDHVAINEHVVAGDMSHTPLADGVLDGAIFSLSLMGANFTDYLIEAARALKLDGTLWIVEAASRFTDREAFLAGLRGLGFDLVTAEERGPFLFIRAIKSRAPRPGVQLCF